MSSGVLAPRELGGRRVRGGWLAGLVFPLLLGSGCTEVRGRRMIQEANELYKLGKYREAVALYDQAEAFVPNLPVLWHNKGFTCRQLLIPGAKTPENRKAAECALQAFERLGQLEPKKKKDAEQRYLETLFDIEDFDRLVKLFNARLAANPTDIDTIRGLQQVYYKAGKWPDALKWYKRAAEVQPTDAESQYAVGQFIWQTLSTRGGGPEMAAYDPRPKGDVAAVPAKAKGKKGAAAAPVAPSNEPQFGPMDITGQLRADLADDGIAYLGKALAIRPQYLDAMTYTNLLYRQKSFAFFKEPEKWQAAVDKANEWMKKSLELMKAQGGYKPPAQAATAPKSEKR